MLTLKINRLLNKKPHRTRAKYIGQLKRTNTKYKRKRKITFDLRFEKQRCILFFAFKATTSQRLTPRIYVSNHQCICSVVTYHKMTYWSFIRPFTISPRPCLIQTLLLGSLTQGRCSISHSALSYSFFLSFKFIWNLGCFYYLSLLTEER